MNKINPRGDINVDRLVEKHREKYSKKYMLEKFDKHTREIWDDVKIHLPDKRKKYDLFIKYLKLKIEDIITGNPETLQKIIDHIETNYGDLPFRSSNFFKVKGKNEQSKLHKQLVKIFNYIGFSKSENWGAYELTEGLNTAVCPYCDRQYVHTFYDEKLKIRATLDHFYDKGTYPFLSISFYNLIPSCYFCNSMLKHTKAFSIKTHLHPYLNDFGEHISFKVKFRNVKGKEQQIDYTRILQADPSIITINLEPNLNSDKQICKLAQKNIHDFKLRELYSVHKDYVSEIIHKSVVYNDAFITSLFKTHPKLFTSEDEITRMVLGNYINVEDQGKRVLSKLVRDTSKQFKLTERLVFPRR